MFAAPMLEHLAVTVGTTPPRCKRGEHDTYPLITLFPHRNYHPRDFLPYISQQRLYQFFLGLKLWQWLLSSSTRLKYCNTLSDR